MRDSRHITIEQGDKVEVARWAGFDKLQGWVADFSEGRVNVAVPAIGTIPTDAGNVTVLRRDGEPGYEGNTVVTRGQF